MIRLGKSSEQWKLVYAEIAVIHLVRQCWRSDSGCFMWPGYIVPCLLMFPITVFCSNWRSVSTFFHLHNLFNAFFQLYLCVIDRTGTMDLLRKSLQHSHEGGMSIQYNLSGWKNKKDFNHLTYLNEAIYIRGNHTWYHIWNRLKEHTMFFLSQVKKTCRI